MLDERKVSNRPVRHGVDGRPRVSTRRPRAGNAPSRRNEKGLPYLIHHYSPNQESCEENALGSWGPIVGHYRMSE